MKLSIDDVKEIANKVTNGVGNYTPIESALVAPNGLRNRRRTIS